MKTKPKKPLLAGKGKQVDSVPSWLTRICRPEPISLLLVILTLASFWSVRENAFVSLDDGAYVTENPHVLGGITWANTAWAFTTGRAGNWNPLTWLSHMLDCQFYGVNPAGHHITSLVLHAANTLLLFWFLRSVTGATWRCLAVAALFAVHPLHVESVAWVAERKDVLSTFFFLLTLGAYAKSARREAKLEVPAAARGGARGAKVGKAKERASQAAIDGRFHTLYYLGSLFFFALGLMSKPMLVTVPCLLLLLDLWPLGRLALPLSTNPRGRVRRLLIEKIPFCLLSLAVSAATIVFQREAGAMRSLETISFEFRLANAFLSYCQYLLQMFWPANLAVFYPFSPLFSPWTVSAAALFVLVTSALVFRVAATRPYLAFGWLWYLMSLLPVIGLLQVGGQAHADRYTYIPLIGVFTSLVWGAYDLTKRWRHHALVLSSAGVVLLFFCVASTRRQVAYWRDSGTLFRQATLVTRNNYAAYDNLGLYLSAQGKSDEAIQNFRQAIEIFPTAGEVYENLGLELLMRGNVNESITNFQNAVRFSPGSASAHCNFGYALANQRKWGEAIREYQESLQLKPEDAQVHRNLGLALDEQGQPEAATGQFTEASRLAPNDPQIRLSLGMALAKQNKRQEAIAQYNEALRLKPDFLQAQQELLQLAAPPGP
jgi:tetratricopeptide (TPR) repeat protein